MDDVDVGRFVPAADVVGLAKPAAPEHGADRAAVVAHVEPVADLPPIAIHRQRLARQGIDDHERNELFGEMERAVVVGAVGGHDRQAVGVVPRTHQVVARCLAGRVRAVGLVGVAFGERRRLGRERAVNLVGADVVKAKGGFLAALQTLPISAARFEQGEAALDVGAHERARAVDRAVDMAFGSEMQHRTRAMLGQQPRHQSRVADVAVHEHMPRIAAQGLEVAQVAGVGEQVEVDHRFIRLREPVEHEVTADEAGAPGDQDHALGPAGARP